MEVQDIDSLILRLTKEEMPIFARTARYVIETSVHANAPITELAWGILRDPALTAKVLKFANSIYYSPNSSKTSTVSRAILQLGFDMVKSICISASLVENLLKGAHRDRTILEMTRAFHAAVQAKSLSTARKNASVEEVFIAALLYRIGHLAFWCFGGELAERLEEALQQPGVTEARAEQEVLGFRIHKLGAALARQWHLGPLLDLSLEGNVKSDPRVYSVILGHKVARSVENGWETPEAEAAITTVAKYLKIGVDEAREMAAENARNAVQVAKDYGLGHYSRLIMLPTVIEQKEESAEQPSDSRPFPQPDLLLQMEILRELSTLSRDDPSNVNLLFSTLLEGIYRGIGMDRVLLLMVSQDRHDLIGKFGLGWEHERIDRFALTLESAIPHIFDLALGENKPVWVRGHKTPQYIGYLTPEVKALMSTSSFFIMPLTVKKRVVGLVCADRHPSGRELDEESFSSFHFFGRIANATLASIA